MTTPSVEDMILTNLSAYLAAAIIAVPGLGKSTVIDQWPEPTQPLSLDQDRVVLSVTRDGESTGSDRLGPPNVVSGVLFTDPSNPGSITSTYLYEFGVVSQPIEIGVWACTDGLRSDVDQIVHSLVNQPLYSTVQPLVNTTLAAPIVLPTTVRVLPWQRIVPASMANIFAGLRMCIGGNDWVTVLKVDPVSFWAAPALAHGVGETVTEIVARTQFADTSLTLRVPATTDTYANRLIHYLFDDGVRTFPSSKASQMQEWRSRRAGRGRTRQMRNYTGIPQLSSSLQTIITTAPISAAAQRIM